MQQPPAAPVCAVAGVGVEESGAAADAGLREGQLDAAGGLVVSGQRGGDGADLLVAGHGQEGGGAAVALHADEVDAVLVVAEHVGAVRVDGAAGVDVGVDERRQLDRRLEPGVEVEAQLGSDAMVGAEAGQPDDLVEVPRCDGRPR